MDYSESEVEEGLLRNY